MIKNKTFEEFLQDKHADGYMGTKDDMPDRFNEWLQLDADEFIAFGDEFAKEQKEELIKEINIKEIKGLLKYCREQNGLPYCKNCGLSEDILSKLK